jgi:sugar transferase (PEP-CTERM/EpsH1 system associated)
MKILFISHFVPYPPRGGALQRNYNLLREISKDHEVHLITLSQKALLPTASKLNESMDVVNKFCKSIKVFKIPTDRRRILWYLLLFVNLFSLSPYSVWRFRCGGMIREIQKQLRNKHFDLIHFDTIGLAQYARFAPGIPKVLNHHNVESVLILRRATNEKNLLVKLYLYLQGWKLKRYEKKVISDFDMNITVSELDKNVLQKLDREAKVTVVSNGVDVDYFRPLDVPAEDDNIVFVASMDWYPNADAAIYFAQEIWPLLKEKLPHIQMNLVGGHPPRQAVELSRKERSFKAHGFADDIRPYMAKAAAYVVPIRIGGGTRLKILDAMAMGKAIVSTSIGSEGLEVTAGENILIADTPQEFVDKIAQIIEEPHLRKHLEENARETAVNLYSWVKIKPKLEGVYLNVATRHL